jgi:hypothetical protein
VIASRVRQTTKKTRFLHGFVRLTAVFAVASPLTEG